MAKMPPIEKMYEAFSAVADGRVILGSEASSKEGSAQVTSSDGAKVYDLAWRERTFASTDNASYWQGYPGYPVIAVLLALGELTVPHAIVDKFAGVNWHEINKRFKRDYAAATEEVFRERDIEGALAGKIRAATQEAYDQLAALDLTIVRKLESAK